MAGRILPAARPQKPSPQPPAPPAAPPPQIRVAPTWRPGDKVRWQGYTGTFLRDVIGGEAEVLIGTRTLRLLKSELRSA